MNNINGIGYGKLPPINGQQNRGKVARQPSAVAENSREDKVQISEMARFLSKIAAMPDIRTEKVEQIKQALADGTYDIDGKLPHALDAFIKEYVP